MPDPTPADLKRAEEVCREHRFDCWIVVMRRANPKAPSTDSCTCGRAAEVQRVARLLAEERERCAVLCDEKAAFSEDESKYLRAYRVKATAFSEAADAIRALGEGDGEGE